MKNHQLHDHLTWKCIFLLVPYINYQGQKLTKSKKYISNNDFSTGFAEGTSHHSTSIKTVPGSNGCEMEMHTTTGLQLYLQTGKCLCTTTKCGLIEHDVKLVLEELSLTSRGLRVPLCGLTIRDHTDEDNLAKNG